MSAAATAPRRKQTEGGTAMATTSSTLAAGKAISGQGGNGNHGRYGLKAKLAAGVAMLGCAAALAFGGLHSGERAQSPAMAPALTSSQADVRAQQLFLEQNLSLPDGGATTPVARERQRFLEVNTQLPSDGAASPLSYERQRFLEVNTQLPSEGAPALIPPGPANFQDEKY
jgi:hypothetical protein